MHTTLATATALFFSALTLQGQVRYTGDEFRSYYDWFHQYSQTAEQFTNGATLYTFTEGTTIYSSASAQASVLTQLPIAHPITNRLQADETPRKGTINGYTDNWLPVDGCDANGNNFQGYVWGGQLAKGWRAYDIDRDGQQDMILFGLNQETRTAPEDLRAEIRLVTNGSLLAQTTLTGMCVFDECDASTLLRILTPTANSTATDLVLEASVLTVGCMTGVDKAFVHWNGQRLECIYQAEYTTGHQYASRSFYLPADNDQTQVCMFSSEDTSYNPVWRCETITSNGRVSVDQATNEFMAAR